MTAQAAAVSAGDIRDRLRRPLRIAAVALPVVLVLLAVLPFDAYGTDLSSRFGGPSAEHLLGTDQLGRDVFARLAVGARVSVGFTVLALLLCAVLGTALGTAAAWGGRLVGQVFQRVVDVLVAVPAVLVGLVAIAATPDGGPGLGVLLLAIVSVGWLPFARLAYQLVLREKGREYVEGAVAVGAGQVRIVCVHVLPNLARPLLAHLCLRFANILLTVAGLSFLGLGPQPPTPEWGAMIAEGRQYMFAAPQLVLVPSVAVVGTALLVVLLGRDLERRALTGPSGQV
ncbi:ABC transporter permease [Pseudonocardia phyllosphaerae]|uniref:ABC transporter permease n=1 Tax=Pseudonocardia phyllosphaerae TaxID=3390502 RepID=UPI0039796AA6